MKKVVFASILGAGFCLLGGCASIVKGTNQSISITTTPVDGARCELSNNKGTWYVNNTPASITVHRSFEELNVRCEKRGYGKGRLSVKSNTTASVAGNVLLGGVIGAGVDVANGAAYDYPQNIVVPLRKS